MRALARNTTCMLRTSLKTWPRLPWATASRRPATRGPFRTAIIVYARVSEYSGRTWPPTRLTSSTLSSFLMAPSSLSYGVGSIAAGAMLQREFTDAQRATMSSLSSFAGSIFFGIVAFGIS